MEAVTLASPLRRERPVAASSGMDRSLVALIGGDAGEGALIPLLLTACADAGRPTRIVKTGQPKTGQPVTAGVVIDLSGRYRPRDGQEVWSIVAGGRCLARRHALAHVWHRPPYSVRVDITGRSGASVARTLASASISTTGDYAALCGKTAATAAILLRQALSGTVSPTGEVPVACSSARFGAFAASGLAEGWLRRQAARWRARLFAEWWTIGVCDRPIEAVLRDDGLGPVDWLRPRVGAAYWADPFAWPDTDRLLCEEYPVGGGPGVIAALRPDGRGGWERDHTVLADGLHRSYPFAFRHENQTYLVPECVEAGAVTLFRLDTSGAIESLATVARGRFADATVFRHEGRFWLAATDLAIGAHDNLCLFHAEWLAGPWRAHRGNPVKIDIRSARSAGTPFLDAGALYRPAQDCAGAYGAAVVINRVVSLTLDGFEEHTVSRLAPDPSGPLPDGLHTLSAAGSRTVIDGKRMVFAPGLAARRVARRLRRVARGSGSGRP